MAGQLFDMAGRRLKENDTGAIRGQYLLQYRESVEREKR
jgi:hypothetical protein